MTDERPRGEARRHRKRKRGQFSSEEQAAILKRHMADRVPVSDLCNELEIQPSLFYHWQRQALENLAAALSGPTSEGPSKREKELLAENRDFGRVRAAKKNWGNRDRSVDSR